MTVLFRNVSFYYGKSSAIKDLSFRLGAGESIAILGANGAGKTTLTKLVTGAIKPKEGAVRVFGEDPWSPQAKLNIGSAPQELEFPAHVTTREIIQFVTDHYPNPRAVEESIALFNMEKFELKYATQLSGGQKRRLALAIAFCGRPKLVVLDEPTTGLDQANRKQIWEFIKKFQADGGTIILTSHYSNEVHEIAQELLLLRAGEFVRSGSFQEHLENVQRARLTFRSPEQPNLSSATFVQSDNGVFVFETQDSDNAIVELVNTRVKFSDLKIIRRSFSEYIEDIVEAS